MFDLFSHKSANTESVDNLVSALHLAEKLINEDSGNFVYLKLIGTRNNKAIKFNKASDIYLEILYTGSSVSYTWEQYNDYTPYNDLKNCFKMFRENNGDFQFCAMVELNGGDALTTLNQALPQTSFREKAKFNDSFVYMPLL